MATVFNQNEEDENKAPTLGGGQSAIIGGQEQTPVQNVGQPKQAGSGRFQNLQKYITANQSGAQQMGQKVQGNIIGQANQLTQNVNQAGQNLQAGANAEIGRLNTEVTNNINQAVADPMSTANDQNKFNQFQQIRQGQNNQQNIGNLNQLQSDQQKVQDNSQATKSEQGRSNLLRQTYQVPNYSQGANRLDQLLLQSRPNDLRNITKETGAAAKVNNQQLEGIQKQRDIFNQQIGNIAQQKAQEANQAVQQAQNPVNQQIQQRIQETQAIEDARKAQYDKITNMLALGAKDEKGAVLSDQDAYTKATDELVKNNFLTPNLVSNMTEKQILHPAHDAEEITTALRDQGYKTLQTPTGQQWFDPNGNPFNPNAFYFYKTPTGEVKYDQNSSSTFNQYGARSADPLNADLDASAKRDLLRRYFTEQNAQNINRQGLANQEEKSRLNALNQLLGNVNEFSDSDQKYQAGSTAFDTDKLKKSVTSLLDERFKPLEKKAVKA